MEIYRLLLTLVLSAAASELIQTTAPASLHITRVEKVGTCVAIVTTSRGPKKIDLREIGYPNGTARRFTVKGDGDGEFYTWSVCQPMNLNKYKKPCLNNLFVYEDRTKKTCEGFGNVTKFSFQDYLLTMEISVEVDKNKKTTITFSCTSGEDALECENNGLACTFARASEFVFKSKLFCLEEAPEPKETATSPPKGFRDWLKLSPGSIVLIVAGVVLATYLVIGVAHGTGKGEKGLNRLPNSDFWLELPLLVKDGAMFLLSGCKSPRKGYSRVNVEDKTAPIADL